MKVALVTYALQVGGIETFLKRLATGLQKAGHTVTVMETESRGVWASEFESAGLTVTDILAHPSQSRLSHARRMAEALMAFDVVILNDAPYAQSVAGLLPEQTVVLSIVHGDMDSMYRNAVGNKGQWDAVVGVGPRLGKRLIGEFGAPEPLTHVIPYGVEVPSEWPRKNEEQRTSEPLRMAYIGRLEDVQKGILRLPAILTVALQTHPGIEMEIVGDGPDSGRLREAFSRDCPNGKVVFSGALTPDEARRRLSKQDVLILPSNFEGLPIVVLEAMAEGVVPVASRLKDMTDFEIEDGRTGFLREPGDIPGFAQALVLLAGDRERLRRMSQAAWQEARNRFTAERMCRDYEMLIGRLTEQRRAGKAGGRRSGKVCMELLGDLPKLPVCMVRPVRKGLRVLGLWRG